MPVNMGNERRDSNQLLGSDRTCARGWFPPIRVPLGASVGLGGLGTKPKGPSNHSRARDPQTVVRFRNRPADRFPAACRASYTARWPGPLHFPHRFFHPSEPKRAKGRNPRSSGPCLGEYENPLDRRFHAEPIACPACGPRLFFYGSIRESLLPSGGDLRDTGKTAEHAEETERALAACIDRLRKGDVIAVKGIGGYHLFCDARSDAAIRRLRARKPRPHKPLAVLFPMTGADGLDAVRSELDLGSVEAARLLSPERPIVLATKIQTRRSRNQILLPSMALEPINPRANPWRNDGSDSNKRADKKTPLPSSRRGSRDPAPWMVKTSVKNKKSMDSSTDTAPNNPQWISSAPEADRRTLVLCAALAPRLGEIGVMLPYSSLHHLLLDDYGAPLVATSANRGGEPVLTDLESVRAFLGDVVQGILDHNRPIVRPADDSVFRRILGKARPIRLGRGIAPVEMELPFSLKQPLLAVGGQMKNTVALAFRDRVVVSPHIGDMDSLRSLRVFEQVAADLQALYGVEAEVIARDAHPGYTTSHWASRWGSEKQLPILKIYHHYAHAGALFGEYPHAHPRLVFTWDGVGYGPDGVLWGGEALLGKPGAWRRIGSLRPFHLPGGERAGREPWRSAAALCWAMGRNWSDCPEKTGLLRAAWERRINAPQTTAIGRLFDAAAALTGICLEASYEGQGPMELEGAAHGDIRFDISPPVCLLPVDKDERGCWRIDWASLVPFLLQDEGDAGYKAAVFRETVARALVTQALCIRSEHDFHEVGLAGGVFQNRLLTERAAELLIENGFRVILPEKIPSNDGGLSFGQVIESGVAVKGP
uniref:HypF finger n=1 Tax=Candidatus Kentrum sp. TC TaxID=2126339 RepID=A0A451A722_9GAMM|nr:MAG: HypF finger [Candidatus Kentron sp. TC]